MKILTGFKSRHSLNSSFSFLIQPIIPYFACHGNFKDFLYSSKRASSSAKSSIFYGSSGSLLNALEDFIRRFIVKNCFQPCLSSIVLASTESTLSVPIPLEIAWIKRFCDGLTVLSIAKI